MRIKRDYLLTIARNTVAERIRYNKRVVSAYLTGSLLGEDFLIGGTADIDLIFIVDDIMDPEHEIVPVSEEVHLDIASLPQRIFQQPRSLRSDPWISPYFCLNPLLLHDTQHWFEFTQASLCSQFNRPEYILQRSRSQSEAARQGWMKLHSNSPWDADKVLIYLKAIEQAANSIALLSGAPLTERRFMLQFARRAAAVQSPGMASGLVDLLTGDEALTPTMLTEWLPAWNHALDTTASLEKPPLRLCASRQPYYARSAEALLSDYPEAALWIDRDGGQGLGSGAPGPR